MEYRSEGIFRKKKELTDAKVQGHAISLPFARVLTLSHHLRMHMYSPCLSILSGPVYLPYFLRARRQENTGLYLSPSGISTLSIYKDISDFNSFTDDALGGSVLLSSPSPAPSAATLPDPVSPNSASFISASPTLALAPFSKSAVFFLPSACTTVRLSVYLLKNSTTQYNQ